MGVADVGSALLILNALLLMMYIIISALVRWKEATETALTRLGEQFI
ncbi:hypothetical protein [Micromonospora sp. AP08]|nr:hypothetical protein [Micromonospora sp. AP08]